MYNPVLFVIVINQSHYIDISTTSPNLYSSKPNYLVMRVPFLHLNGLMFSFCKTVDLNGFDRFYLNAILGL